MSGRQMPKGWKRRQQDRQREMAKKQAKKNKPENTRHEREGIRVKTETASQMVEMSQTIQQLQGQLKYKDNALKWEAQRHRDFEQYAKKKEQHAYIAGLCVGSIGGALAVLGIVSMIR